MPQFQCQASWTRQASSWAAEVTHRQHLQRDARGAARTGSLTFGFGDTVARHDTMKGPADKAHFIGCIRWRARPRHCVACLACACNECYSVPRYDGMQALHSELVRNDRNGSRDEIALPRPRTSSPTKARSKAWLLSNCHMRSQRPAAHCAWPAPLHGPAPAAPSRLYHCSAAGTCACYILITNVRKESA